MAQIRLDYPFGSSDEELRRQVQDLVTDFKKQKTSQDNTLQLTDSQFIELISLGQTEIQNRISIKVHSEVNKLIEISNSNSKSSNRIAYAGFFISLLAFVAALYGVYANYEQLQVIREQGIRLTFSDEASTARWKQALQEIYLILPSGGVSELDTYPNDKKVQIMRDIKSKLDSQVDNTALISNKKCYQAWDTYRNFIFLSLPDPGQIGLANSINNMYSNVIAKCY